MEVSDLAPDVYRGTVEGEAIPVAPRVSVVPVVGWSASPRRDAGSTGIQAVLLGILVATLNGTEWTGIDDRSEDYPTAAMSPPPPLPTAELVSQAVEVERSADAIWISGRRGEPYGRARRPVGSNADPTGGHFHGEPRGFRVDRTGDVERV